MIRAFRQHIGADSWLICPWGDKGAFASDVGQTYSRYEAGRQFLVPIDYIQSRFPPAQSDRYPGRRGLLCRVDHSHDESGRQSPRRHHIRLSLCRCQVWPGWPQEHSILKITNKKLFNRVNLVLEFVPFFEFNDSMPIFFSHQTSQFSHL